MDTSKEYIEMCRKAAEIQEVWEPKDGDFSTGDFSTGVGSVIVQMPSKWSWKPKVIWLPRQDQLQDMVDWSGYGYKVSTICYQIDEFYEKGGIVWGSMEQLWLAFVMHEKYGKKWNGGDWVCQS